MRAIVCGPLLLFFAWATFVRAPHRHVVGIIATSIIVYAQALYFAVALVPHSIPHSFVPSPSLAGLVIWDIVTEVPPPPPALK